MASGNPRPRMSLEHRRDGGVCDAVFPRQRAKALPSGVFAADRAGVIGGDLDARVPVPSPAFSGVCVVPMLSHHVAQVFTLRAKEQMIGSDAQRVVASMAHALTTRNGAVHVEPRQAVCAPQLPTMPLLPVSVGAGRFGPDPAFAVATNTVPESARLKCGQHTCGVYHT